MFRLMYTKPYQVYNVPKKSPYVVHLYNTQKIVGIDGY
jgi:hypothetical protein